MDILYVFFPSVVAGIIQSTTGFGSGIFMMLFFPLFMDLLPAAGLSCLISLFSNIRLSYQYRKHIQFRSIGLPIIAYFTMSLAAVKVAQILSVSGLKAYFGLFMIALAVYFIFFSERIRILANWRSALICGLLAGTSSGFFGIGGPPMVIYFLAMAGEDKHKYAGTIQFFFAVTGLYVTIVRILEGILTWNIVGLLVSGTVGILIGSEIGTRILAKLKVNVMKKLIYVFLALAGVVTFVSNF